MKGSHQQSSLLLALTKQNLVPPEKVDEINAGFSAQSKPFIRYLVEEKKFHGPAIADILSKSFGYPHIDLTKFDIAFAPQGILNIKLIRKHNALPLYLRGKVLFIAMSDPTNIDALEEIQFNTGYITELILTDENGLQTCIEKVLEDTNDGLDINNIDAEELSGIEVDDNKETEDR